MERTQKAKELFIKGYNCSQSVSMAFSDIVNIDEETLSKISAPFGGGMGRMREVCGAVSGMLMIFGLLYGDFDPTSHNEKSEHYKAVQELANEFKERCTSIICKEILKNPSSSPAPTPRDEKFYKERPCVRMVMTATEILENFIKTH